MPQLTTPPPGDFFWPLRLTLGVVLDGMHGALADQFVLVQGAPRLREAGTMTAGGGEMVSHQAQTPRGTGHAHHVRVEVDDARQFGGPRRRRVRPATGTRTLWHARGSFGQIAPQHAFDRGRAAAHQRRDLGCGGAIGGQQHHLIAQPGVGVARRLEPVGQIAIGGRIERESNRSRHPHPPALGGETSFRLPLAFRNSYEKAFSVDRAATVRWRVLPLRRNGSLCCLRVLIDER